MKRSTFGTVALLATLAFVVGCADEEDWSDDPEQGSYEGVDEDVDPTVPLDDGKSDAPRYEVPTDLPELYAPEIIISLDGLTVHLFDRLTGFSKVYPAGVGVKDESGKSITPVGHFKSGPRPSDGWWYAPRRTNPEYFAGLPFLRFTARNASGSNAYGMHGPITETLRRGYVSHGCIRMSKSHIIRLFHMVKRHANIPITIQTEVERDAAGRKVDVGMTPKLYNPGIAIPYGASVGPRPMN